MAVVTLYFTNIHRYIFIILLFAFPIDAPPYSISFSVAWGSDCCSPSRIKMSTKKRGTCLSCSAASFLFSPKNCLLSDFNSVFTLEFLGTVSIWPWKEHVCNRVKLAKCNDLYEIYDFRGLKWLTETQSNVSHTAFKITCTVPSVSQMYIIYYE